MAIDNFNMMAEIDREIKKIQARDTGRDTLDVITEAWDMGKEQRVWNERKNFQRQGMMSELGRGTSMIFNEKDLAHKKERFQNYYNKYKGSMDEATLEMGQFMLDDFDMQVEKNKDFEFQHGRLKSMQDNMSNAFNEFDRMDASQNAAYADKAKNLNEEWLGYVSDFKKTHGERLSLKPFQHIDAQLDSGKAMNDFLLEALRDDKYIDDMEYQAYQDSWDNLSTDPIKTYRQKEAVSNEVVLRSASKQLIENVEEYKGMEDFILRGTPIELDGIQTRFSDLDEGGAEQIMYLEQLDQLQKEIKNLDNNYSNKTGKSYMAEMHPDLFKVEDTPPPPPKVKVPTEKEEIKELERGEEFKVPQGDLDTLKSELAKAEKRGYTGEDRSLADFIRGRAGYKKIFNEFEKAKDIDSSTSFDDFISHRPDLYSGWKEKQGRKETKKSKAQVKAKFRKEVGKIKSASLKYDIMSGKGYKGSVPIAKSKKIKGKQYMFYFSSNEDGSLRIDKVLRNRDTGKYSGKPIKSSIQEWEA